MTLILHNFFRSSSSTRLRAALNFKGLSYDYVAYVLRKGETQTPEFLARNPQGLVPVLELDDGSVLTQSLAIIEWLEETHPEPPLFPSDAMERARVRAFAYAVACEVHPLNNLRVLLYLAQTLGLSEEAVAEWFRHWVAETFGALETMLVKSETAATFCFGDTPTLADLCLYAQIWNNRRFDISLDPYPTIARIFAELDRLPAFRDAAPPNQPDAV